MGRQGRVFVQSFSHPAPKSPAEALFKMAAGLVTYWFRGM